MKWMLFMFAVLGVVVGGCGNGSSTGTGAKGKLVGLHYMEDGAPDPLACKSDAECVASTIVLAAGPCCPVPNPYAQTVAWKNWIQKRRNEMSCSKVKCPEQAKPAPPPSCAMEVSCVANKCRDSCK